MWRATFAWHVEDMDLFSINYIHFGAPKFWYAIPQKRASALEMTMKGMSPSSSGYSISLLTCDLNNIGYFPKEVSNCSQFLRHKSFLASPKILAQSSCQPNTLVQHAGEFVVTFPRGYHAGFNLGFNCAESVNFALNSWIDMGRVAKACECVDFRWVHILCLYMSKSHYCSYSVRIDVDQLLRDREAERLEEAKGACAKRPRKRKLDSSTDEVPRPKKPRKVNRVEVVITMPPPLPPTSPPKVQPKVTLKLGPRPKEPDVFPCCLCVSTSRDGLLRVHDRPIWRMEADSGESSSGSGVWMAHEECANVIPETWVDEVEVGLPHPDGTRDKDRVIMGVDAIVKDRWNLVSLNSSPSGVAW